MELVTHKKLYLVSGRISRPLAESIAAEMGESLGEPNLAEFSNGEIHCRFSESIRGCDVFIIQTHCHGPETSINDALMEQLIMVDAARRASAKRITVVCPHYGYARQDRKSSGREPITAKLVANLFKEAGASRLVSVDLHSGQIQGFFDGPVDHLTAMPVLVDRLRTLQGDLAIVSPDAGRVKVAERYAIQLGADLAIVHNGHITNYHILRRRYEQRGVRFYTDNDSEVIGIYLGERIAGGCDLREAMEASLVDLDGSFSYLAATPEAMGYARDPFALKPLLWTENDAFVAVATEEISMRAALEGDYEVRETGAREVRIWQR